MTEIALPRMCRSTASVSWFSLQRLLRALTVFMSSDSDDKKAWLRRDDLSPQEKFWAYLDGYMMSFDLYPVCDKQLFMRNDAYALLRDFLAVGHDVNRATLQVLNAPDEEFADTGMKADEIRRRRLDAAKRTLAAIERAKAGTPQSE